MISSLVAAFIDNIEADETIAADVTEAISIELRSGASFVPAEQVDRALSDAGLDSSTVGNVVAGYEDAQLQSLKVGLLVAAFIAAGALLLTRDLPIERLEPDDAEDEPRTSPS